MIRIIIRFTDLRVKTRYGCLGLLPSQPNHKVSSWPGAAPSPCHTSDRLRWTAAVRRDQLEHLWAGRHRQIGDGCRRVSVAPSAPYRPLRGAMPGSIGLAARHLQLLDALHEGIHHQLQPAQLLGQHLRLASQCMQQAVEHLVANEAAGTQ